MYQQETQLYYLWNTTNFFQKNALTFLNHKYSKLFQFNFPETYLSNLCIEGRLKLLEDGFFKILMDGFFKILIFIRPSLVSDIEL